MNIETWGEALAYTIDTRQSWRTGNGRQTALINATTHEGDLVLDPASGGFSVFEACKLINRDFIGCDLKVQ